MVREPLQEVNHPYAASRVDVIVSLLNFVSGAEESNSERASVFGTDVTVVRAPLEANSWRSVDGHSACNNEGCKAVAALAEVGLQHRRHPLGKASLAVEW